MSWQWSPRRAQGFALGAAAREDRGARRAEPGLVPEVAAQALGFARELDALDRVARRQRLQRLLSASTAPQESMLSQVPRARGLLAAEVPRELGRRWLAQSPTPRAGYRADPRLLALLRTLAAGDRAEG